jgi:hypothetical protein
VSETTAVPTGMLGAFDELLKRPDETLARADEGASVGNSWRLLAGAALLWVLYGAGAGFFQGGSQIAVAALKTGLIVAFGLALCVPSLYVLASLAGADLSLRRFLAIVTGFAGTLGLLLLALLPVGWLFSLSSNYLASAVWLHLLLWTAAVAFAARFLSNALRRAGAGFVVCLWICLFCAVCFQVTTLMRPVLWRPAGTSLFDANTKLFFLDQFGRIHRVPAVVPPPKKG